MQTENALIVPVLLSGGSGTRLWPLSRKSYPKQFAPLLGEETLVQQAALRFADTLELGPGPAVFETRPRTRIAFAGRGRVSEIKQSSRQLAGPVGEALVMTAAGLAVALPAVLAYNLLGRSGSQLEAVLEGFAHDLHAQFGVDAS